MPQTTGFHVGRFNVDTCERLGNGDYYMTKGTATLTIPVDFQDEDSNDSSNTPIMAASEDTPSRTGKMMKRIYGWLWGIFT